MEKRKDTGACVSSLICAAREKSDAAGTDEDMETDRVNLCGTEPGPVTHTHG